MYGRMVCNPKKHRVNDGGDCGDRRNDGESHENGIHSVIPAARPIRKKAGSTAKGTQNTKSTDAMLLTSQAVSGNTAVERRTASIFNGSPQRTYVQKK